MDNFPEKNVVALRELLAAREARWQKVQDYIKQYCCSVICLTLNIPGPVKQFPLGDAAFIAGMEAIAAALQEENIPTASQFRQIETTGYTGLIAVHSNGAAIKKLTCQVEETHPLGRIFDIDVYDENFRLISRSDLNYPVRKCLICDSPAHECSRSRAHDLDELRNKIADIISHYISYE